MAKNALQKHGTVQSFNVSPKGTYEGLLLKNDTELIQINCPQELGETLTSRAAEGNATHVEVEAEATNGHASHPVYRLLKIGNAGNETPERADGHFSGKVERFNYALHGEVNGAILDSGDFLHLKPHGAAVVGLSVGMKVNGRGGTKPMIGGHRVIEAEEVNGVRIEKKPKPKKNAAHG